MASASNRCGCNHVSPAAVTPKSNPYNIFVLLVKIAVPDAVPSVGVLTPIPATDNFARFIAVAIPTFPLLKIVIATAELLSAMPLFPTVPLAVNFATLFVVPVPPTRTLATESMPFCLHAFVLKFNVSAVSVPVVVIVPPVKPYPVATDVTVPLPPAGIAAFFITPSTSE